MMRNRWKGLVVGLGAMALVAGAARSGHAAAACGDLNGNGSVTVADAGLLLKAVAGVPVPTACGGMGVLACGDMNADGSITPGDYVILQRYIAGLPTLFPICTGQGTAIASGTTFNAGTINTSQVWTSGAEMCCSATPNTITINGTVFVAPGVTITIKPGTVIKGVKGAATPSVLVFLPGSKINAPGRPDCPIIMTSNQAAGSRGIGDWGGLVLNGNAPVNCTGGTCLAEGLTSILFGGSNPNDDSGIMHYVRIEYSGIEISTDNELNILTQNGLGAATQMDHIQTNVGFDDCFEWFGGTLHQDHFVASGCGDDIYDWQLGSTNTLQFALGVDRQTFLQPGNGNNGYEADNNENGHDNLPRSSPKMCNMTLIGTQSQPGATGGHGALLRRGTNGKLADVLLADWHGNGVNVRDLSTMCQGCTEDGGPHCPIPGGDCLKLSNTITCGSGGAVDGSDGSIVAGTPCPAASGAAAGKPVCSVDEWYDIQSGNQPAVHGAAGTEPACPINTAYPTSVADVDAHFVPSAGSIADGTGQDCHALDPAFATTNYVGAFQPGLAGTWLDNTSCWISFAQN